MPAKDLYHDSVRIALEKDGWIITNDPLSLSSGRREVFIDLAAEKLILAEKKNHYIAVEIKSFINPSLVKDLENALGQYIVYSSLIQKQQPFRTLYLAIRDEIYLDFFTEEIVQTVLEFQPIKLLIFDAQKEEIVKWIN
jgi:hypothetical protein